jgi:hypothetical protein
MKFSTSIHEHGFYLAMDCSKDRTHMVTWEASDDLEVVYGQVDMGFLEERQGVFIHTGFKPAWVKIEEVRDQTPGVYQPVISQIPAGSCMLQFVAETPVNGRIDIMISPTGHANDSRSCGQIPICSSAKNLQLPIVTRHTWKKLFIKKMGPFDEKVTLSGIMLVFPDQRRYATMNHLIKLEHVSLKKSDKSRIHFPLKCPQYAYFNIGFQKQ